MSDKALLIAFECLAFFSAGYFGLAEAKSWVLKRFGGRLSAHLFLKARNLRKKHVALLLQQRERLAVVVVSPNDAHANKQPEGANPIPSIHSESPSERLH